MTRRELGWLALLLAVLAVGLVAAWRARPPLGASATSSRAEGWLATRRYLEARGTRTTLATRPISSGTKAFVLAFPLSSPLSSSDERGLVAAIRAGSVGLVAYSSAPSPEERSVLESLGLGVEDVRGRAPLGPRAYLAWRRESWSLRPPQGGEAVVVRARRFLPAAPASARPLLVTPDGTPAGWTLPIGRGQVVVLPAEALCNARVATAGNLALLEALRELLGESWVFDEYHHGLQDAGAAGTSAVSGAVVLAIAGHLVALYALGVMAVARRLGPAWPEPRPRVGSNRTFLIGLGARHHALGHHADAARLMAGRARALDPRLELPAGLEEPPARTGPGELVEMARAVARAQGWRRVRP